MGRYAFFGDLTQLRRALEITLPPPARPGRGAMLPQGIDHGRRHREVADFRDNHGVPAPISLEWRRTPSAVVACGVAIDLTKRRFAILRAPIRRRLAAARGGRW